MASSEAGSKKEPYGIPRRVIPKKRGGIGRAAVSDARFGQRSFIRMQLRPRLLLGSTCDHVATGNRATATAVPASLFLSYKRRQGSFNGFGLNHADQRGGSRHEKKTFLPSRGASHFRSC